MIALLMINDANVLAARQTVKFRLRVLRTRARFEIDPLIDKI